MRKPLILCCLLLAPIAQAETPAGAFTPFDVLTIYVPSAEGGSFDRTAGAIRNALAAEGLVRNVEIVRLPGAGGLIALAQFLGSEKGDGTAVILGGRTLLGAAEYNRSTVTLENAKAIARLNGVVIGIAVAKESPVRTMGDLLETIRTDPDLVRWTGGSIGSSDQFLINSLYEFLGVNQDYVHFVATPGGGDPVVENLLDNGLTAAVSTIDELSPALRAGRIRIIAISADKRLPSVAAETLREYGIDRQLSDWRGVFASPEIDDASFDRLATLFDLLSKSDAWAAEIADHKWQNLYLKGDEFSSFLKSEQVLFIDSSQAAYAQPGTRGRLARILARRYQWAIAAAIVSAMLLIALARQRMISIRRQIALSERLRSAEAEAARANQERDRNLAGATTYIGCEFEKWTLTEAETEIGWMLLKGLSFKEIANARGTSERTVRQQARSIYAKSGLGNRSDLSAHFLEDICFGAVENRGVDEVSASRPMRAPSVS